MVPKNKINTFEPKALPKDMSLDMVRSTMMGAAFRGEFNKLAPAPAALCKILWEAGRCLVCTDFVRRGCRPAFLQSSHRSNQK